MNLLVQRRSPQIGRDRELHEKRHRQGEQNANAENAWQQCCDAETLPGPPPHEAAQQVREPERDRAEQRKLEQGSLSDTWRLK